METSARSSMNGPSSSSSATVVIEPELHAEKCNHCPLTEASPHEPETAVDDIGPPPDGGLRAWLQVLAGFLTIFNALGYLISFGVFQSYYTGSLSVESSSVSWIGGVQMCLIYLVGTFSGRAFDAGHFALTQRIGFLLQLGGVFATSCAARYWEIMLAQGLCQGLGCGLVFAPTIANVSTYFSTKKTLALCMVACGSAVGGVVFPAIANHMLPRLGFGWTIRIMGTVMLVNCILVSLLTKTRLPPRKSGPLVEVEAFREPDYLLFCIGMFFALWATFFGYDYSPSYALDVLLGTQTASFSMLIMINSVGVPGRLVPAYLADRYLDGITVMVPTVFAASITMFSWAAVRSIDGDYAWVVVFGYFGSGIQGLLPAVCASLTSDLSKSGTRIGMVFSIMSIACLTGPPLAGRLVQMADGSYFAAQMWAGGCLMLGALLTMGACWASRSRRRAEKKTPLSLRG